MCVDRVRLELSWESSQEQLVEDVPMIYIEVRRDLAKPPIGQRLGCEIDLSCVSGYKRIAPGLKDGYSKPKTSLLYGFQECLPCRIYPHAPRPQHPREQHVIW